MGANNKVSSGFSNLNINRCCELQYLHYLTIVYIEMVLFNIIVFALFIHDIDISILILTGFVLIISILMLVNIVKNIITNKELREEYNTHKVFLVNLINNKKSLQPRSNDTSSYNNENKNNNKYGLNNIHVVDNVRYITSALDNNNNNNIVTVDNVKYINHSNSNILR